MSAPKNLTDCYTEELADNWSANDQMQTVVRQMADKAGDDTLAKRFRDAADHIDDNTAVIRALLKDCGVTDKEHCKGMEGLVKEAKKHAIDADISDSDVRDVILITQYQRMCHYGIAGLGSAKAFAEALGKDEHARKLDDLVADIYRTDENMTDLAERSVNLRAKEAEAA